MRGHAFSCSWEISAPEKAPVWDDIVCYNDERLLRTPLLPIWGATVCDLLRFSRDRGEEQYQKADSSVLGTQHLVLTRLLPEEPVPSRRKKNGNVWELGGTRCTGAEDAMR